MWSNPPAVGHHVLLWLKQPDFCGFVEREKTSKWNRSITLYLYTKVLHLNVQTQIINSWYIKVYLLICGNFGGP